MRASHSRLLGSRFKHRLPRALDARFQIGVADRARLDQVDATAEQRFEANPLNRSRSLATARQARGIEFDEEIEIRRRVEVLPRAAEPKTASRRTPNGGVGDFGRRSAISGSIVVSGAPRMASLVPARSAVSRIHSLFRLHRRSRSALLKVCVFSRTMHHKAGSNFRIRCFSRCYQQTRAAARPPPVQSSVQPHRTAAAGPAAATAGDRRP